MEHHELNYRPSLTLSKNGIQDSNLDALSNLQFIGGNLILFDNENLTNLVGLSNLDSIGGDLIIENNRRVQSIDGFGKVTNLPHNLVIFNNRGLSSLSGFKNLTTVTGSVSIDRNPVLKTIKFDSLSSANRISISYGGVDLLSFPKLTTVHEFWIRSVPLLTEISNLVADKYYILDNGGLTTISQLLSTSSTEVVIGYNPSLNNLNGAFVGTEIYNLNISGYFTSLGIDNLQHVHNNLTLGTTGLTSLDGEFPGLTQIDGSLRLGYNYNLQTLTNAFPLLRKVGTLSLHRNDSLIKMSDWFALLTEAGLLDVSFNPLLPQCDVDLLMARFLTLGSFIANDNDNDTICP